jgi:hypothetical protein
VGDCCAAVAHTCNSTSALTGARSLIARPC